MPDPAASSAASSTLASALLLDDTTLAGLARTTLAAADAATVVGGVPIEVGIRDHDGEPALTPAGGSAELPAAVLELVGRGRRTTLVVSPRLDDGVWLVLDGRLCERDGTVVLAVEAVWVGCPHGHGHARPLDLDAYATAAPDALRAAMPRIVAHANDNHGPELRELAHRRLGTPESRIAGASLRELTAAGVTLRVVDLDGGHDLRLPFLRPAVEPCELLGLLRHVLTS